MARMSETFTDVPMFAPDPVAPAVDHPQRKRGGARPGAGRPKTSPEKLAARRVAEKAQRDANRAAREAADAADPIGRIIHPPTSPAGGRPSTMSKQSAVLTDQLAGAYALAGSFVASAAILAPRRAARLIRVGSALEVNAERCAASVVAYSETNPRVRRILESAGGTTGLLAIALAHAPILMAVIGRDPEPGSEPTVDVGALFDGMDLSKLADLAGQMFPGAVAPPGDGATAEAA